MEPSVRECTRALREKEIPGQRLHSGPMIFSILKRVFSNSDMERLFSISHTIAESRRPKRQLKIDKSGRRIRYMKLPDGRVVHQFSYK